MLYNENLHEEERHLIQQIAEQTERGKIGWELTEYNPLSFLNEDKIDKNPDGFRTRPRSSWNYGRSGPIS